MLVQDTRLLTFFQNLANYTPPTSEITQNILKVFAFPHLHRTELNQTLPPGHVRQWAVFEYARPEFGVPLKLGPHTAYFW